MSIPARTIYVAPSITGPVSEPDKKQGALQWLWNLLPHREDIIVAGREVKGGIVIHPIIATAILGVCVTIGLGLRSEMNWQHDQLIILSTQKMDSEKTAKEDRDKRDLQESADRAWREKMSNQMAELKLQYQSQRSN